MKQFFRMLAGSKWGNRALAVWLTGATVVGLPAQTFKNLHSFCALAGCADGSNSIAAPIQGLDGNLYGTTVFGGAAGYGTVFKITPGGKLTTLYNFCSQTNCTDGAYPYAGLLLATNGAFYGTTYQGGAAGNGTIFKITAAGVLTTLYSLCTQTTCADGKNPYASLVQGQNGLLYGTTSGAGGYNAGTVFQISPAGAFKTLYSFCAQTGCTDGANPYAGLVAASNGALYGTTYYGGASDVGTVFQITTAGKLTPLHSFNTSDGAGPRSELVQGTDGKLYGTTSGGGANSGGTFFQITTSGTLNSLYSFCAQSSCTDGANPNAGVIQATNGYFYGTTQFGGATNYGTTFKISSAGVLTTLYPFCSVSACGDGESPFGSLVQSTNGSFYGTATYGGNLSCSGGCGTAFTISDGLGAFVEALPAGAKVGTSIKILGSNLTGATSVTFNGVAAAFTVLSKFQIKATVPTGATTGTIVVVTPTATLMSNVPFTVR